MQILGLVRKEFRHLRLLWTRINISVSAHHEIVLVKEKLIFCFENILKPEKNYENGPPKKKTKMDKEYDIFKNHVSKMGDNKFQ